MPRFFFDMREPEIPDDDGVELPDAETACREASLAAAEMLKDAALRGGQAVALIVRDEQGRPACTVTARITVARR